MVRYYTGIGSRNISAREQRIIKLIAQLLREKGFIVYSGNAKGADIAFQEGSDGECLISLPWSGFNKYLYDYENRSIDRLIVPNVYTPDFKDGLDSVEVFHHNPKKLDDRGKRLMVRNYYQVTGFNNYPKSEIVICCADEDDRGRVMGGTGQAVRIAKSMKIPVINIREEINWLKRIKELIK